jgi:DNA (cytosine-5)-methyltransferase 1
MVYIEGINALLVPHHTENAVVLDLFAGCGGLALGFEAAGYKTIGFEMKEPAAASYRHNLGSECTAVKLEIGFDFPQATHRLPLGS